MSWGRNFLASFKKPIALETLEDRILLLCDLSIERTINLETKMPCTNTNTNNIISNCLKFDFLYSFISKNLIKTNHLHQHTKMQQNFQKDNIHIHLYIYIYIYIYNI